MSTTCRWCAIRELFSGQNINIVILPGTVLRNLTANSAVYGDAIDPGDRKSGFDFLWRLPLPGRPVTLYADLYADDEPNPLASPRRSAIGPGIYFPRIPGLPHWDSNTQLNEGARQ